MMNKTENKIQSGELIDQEVQSEFLKRIQAQLRDLLDDLFSQAKLGPAQLLVVGCSSSEIHGGRIGHASSSAIGEAVFRVIHEQAKQRGIAVAAQCCEHLNRALVMERADAERNGYEEVNVVPWLKGGGSFATAAYAGFDDPVVVEAVRADAGLDIGETLIGMHLKSVAVPLRLESRWLGDARVTAARVRPRCIGGVRARYNEKLG